MSSISTNNISNSEISLENRKNDLFCNEILDDEFDEEKEKIILKSEKDLNELLRNKPRLRILKIEYCCLKKEIQEIAKNFPDLEVFEYETSNILPKPFPLSNAFVDLIINCPNLKHFSCNIDGSEIEQFCDYLNDGNCNLESLTLRGVDFSNVQITNRNVLRQYALNKKVLMSDIARKKVQLKLSKLKTLNLLKIRGLTLAGFENFIQNCFSLNKVNIHMLDEIKDDPLNFFGKAGFIRRLNFFRISLGEDCKNTSTTLVDTEYHTLSEEEAAIFLKDILSILPDVQHKVRIFSKIDLEETFEKTLDKLIKEDCYIVKLPFSNLTLQPIYLADDFTNMKIFFEEVEEVKFIPDPIMPYKSKERKYFEGNGFYQDVEAIQKILKEFGAKKINFMGIKNTESHKRKIDNV